MSVLSQFNAAVEASRNAVFSDPLDIINDAANNNHISNRFLFGKGQVITIDGGLAIEDVTLLEAAGNFRPYRPMERTSITNRQPGTKWRCPWTYFTDEMVWTEQEVSAQIDAGLRNSVKVKRIKDLMKLKEMQLYTSIIQGIDDLLFAQPDAASQEVSAASVDTDQPYSIPTFINEFTNGLYASTESGTFSTVQAINPAVHPNWDSRKATYTVGSETSETGGILPAFNKIMRKLGYNKPAMHSEYFTGREQGDRSKVLPSMFVACSQLGYDEFHRAVKSTNNAYGTYDLTTVNRLDPGVAALAYGGAVLEEIQQLDTAVLYPGSGSSLQTEANASNAGPRYYVIDPNYLKLAFKGDCMMQKGPVEKPSEMIDTYYQRNKTWFNLVCTSRRRHGIIYPTS